jgi:hypothetical protein
VRRFVVGKDWCGRSNDSSNEVAREEGAIQACIVNEEC